MALAKEDLPALAALLKVQQKLKAPKEKKGNGISYKYRSAEQIFENLKELLEENGATLYYTHNRLLDERCTPLLHTTGYFVDIASGASIISEFTSEVATKANMDAGQKYGALASYNEKYIACSLFLIDNGADDLDGNKDLQVEKAYKSPEPIPQSITQEQAADINLERIKEEISRLGINFKVVSNIIKRKFKKDKYAELNTNQQTTLLTNLEAWSKES